MTQRMTVAIVVACVALTMACRTTPRREDVCLGERYVGVQNDTGEPVDVYMVKGGISRLVATVSAGTTELPLPSGSDAGGVYRGRRQKDGRWINAGHRSGNLTARLTFQEKCDTPRP